MKKRSDSHSSRRTGYRRTLLVALVLGLALMLSVGAASADPEVLNTNRDQFGSTSYSNNNGTENWAGNWTETGEATSPSGGDIQITGGELRIDNTASNEPSVQRAVNANMANAQYATLSFEYRTTNLEYTDELAVEVSTDNGTTFTTLEIFHENNTGSRVYGISEFISATTVIRFRVNNGLSATDEFYYLDNVMVSYDTVAQKTYHDIGWEGGILGDNNNRTSPAQTCSEPAVLYFSVYDDFTITDLNVGINVTHIARGDVRVTLDSPSGTTHQIVASNNSDTDDNYDILVDDGSGAALDDGSADNIDEPFYDRTVGPSTNGDLDDYNGENAKGVWKAVVCDAYIDDGARSGMSNHVTLFFTGTDNPTPPPPGGETSGPTTQVYYTAFPEDQVKLLMDTVYEHDGPGVPTACADTNSTSQTYNTNPKNPVISRSGIAILYDNTVLYYDHFEDGYETDLTTRNQQSTEHWGDGNLTNGVAPIGGGQYDADDVLEKGDVVIIADAVQTEFLGDRFEYAAGDKIGATAPVAVTRAAWASGSSTLLAGALELYPTNRWGLEYELPVGEDDSINDMFEYVGVSIMAAQDGTTVTIDRDGPGGVAAFNVGLSEGEAHQENGNMDVGATIVADKPIQVSMITADVCAFFESRWFTLFPTDQWDDSYFLPVGTKTTSAGTGIADDVPTYAHVYNPNDNGSAITVNWETQGPTSQGSFNVNLGDRVNVTVPNGEAAHFWTVAAGPTENVRDEFSTNGSYAGNNGSVNWSANWVEVNDTGGAGGGVISVTGNELAIDGDGGIGVNLGDYVYRTADLSSAVSATLTFVFDEDSSGSADEVCVYASSDGNTWNELVCVNGDTPDGSASEDLSAYVGGTVYVRFYVEQALETGDEFYFDNVDITYTEPGAGDPPVFNVVATVDSDAGGGGGDDRNDTTDWGFAVVPESQMSTLFLSSLAPGYDPEYVGTAFNNAGPLFVTAYNSSNLEATTDVCVDYNTDGGPNTDAGTGFEYDQLFTITDLDSFKIYDNSDGDNDKNTNDLDQSGMFVFVCNGTSGIITAAWGQDPDEATGGRPAIDVGTTVPNLVPFAIAKDAELAVDLNGNSLYDPGDTIEYEIEVFNAGTNAIPANTLVTTDEVPANTTYVPGTTEYEQPDTTVLPIADGPGNTLPLTSANSGFTYPHILAVGDSFLIRFQVKINVPFPLNIDSILNEAQVTDGIFRLEADVEVPVQPEDFGAIGNYVWLDEDGDGDQDAGEHGIPNVTVELWEDTDGDDVYDTLVATTYTDAEGGYLFPGLPAGEYQVRVISSTLPDPDGGGPGGLHQTFDEDDGTGPFASPHTTNVSLGSGVEHLTADFGYNWAPPADTNNPGPGVLGAIGDRVWYDTDGDGVQDVGELGIAGVPLTLYYDSDSDGVVDAVWPVDTGNGPGVAVTDANGFYIFDELPPGIYEVVANGGLPVAGTVQTGDPDQYGVTCTTSCDNRTTSPVVLGPGDVFLNVDFGYQQQDETFSIGNLVFFDANADGNYDANGQDGLPGTTADNEYGIANVSVSLIRDNGDGIYNPADDPIVATTITDANGNYLFDGLPAGTQYFVWVDDTENVVLTDLQQSAEPGGVDNGVPCVACNDRSPVVVPVGPDNLFQDFGYRPAGILVNPGLIGDTVFLDYNNDGLPDPGEGIEGVVVSLYDATGTTKLAQTVTDENGHYYFGNLDPTATYVVQVNTASLPGGGAGLENTVDPDGGFDSISTVDLSLSPNGINLDQDFGYIADDTEAGSIGNLVWYDTNADGDVDVGEPGIPGVTVDLYEDVNGNGILDSGDRLVGQTVTNGGGGYVFDDLPPANYLVDVTDTAGLLNGMWHSLGTPGADNNSQVDPYPVALGPNEDYVAADFGYYKDPAALGNYVWIDADEDGIQDAGETPLPNVEVQLEITYPSGDVVILTTLTDANGFYSFNNLLLDEDYNGIGTPTVDEPQYEISIDLLQPALAGYQPTLLNQGTGLDDSDDPNGVFAQTRQGATDVSAQANPNDEAPNAGYDFGFITTPTAITFSTLDATRAGYVWLPAALLLAALTGLVLLRLRRKGARAAG